MAANSRNRGGRPKGTGKGDRDFFATRPARPVGDKIRAEADRLDVPYGELISYAVAQYFGMPEHAPAMPNPPEEQELPMQDTA